MNRDDLMDEAREIARDALGDQADDEVLLQEVAEQIYESMTRSNRGAGAGEAA